MKIVQILIKKVPPVYSEVPVHLKNIEIPGNGRQQVFKFQSNINKKKYL